MKIRSDFVTNSSSSSFIICFARIKDMDKAKKIIDECGLEVLDANDVKNQTDSFGELGADWCGAVIYGVDDILAAHPNSKYIIITDSQEADYDEKGYAVYDCNFSESDTIDKITEENGFANIDIAEGEGFDG
ncbi:MAG TPA: hypothetical protein OIL97_04355 [Oscillospiraceae bacterium]|jgi:hypothetical protein|nr:hypothetical protein [Oscillospiraceae bacterium]